MTQQPQGRKTLLLLLLLFCLPVGLVVFMYVTGWHPSGQSHGDLLQPPKPMSLQSYPQSGGQPMSVAQWHNKWHLVYLEAGQCGADCLENVHMMRQIHASLDKQMDRLERVLLIAARADSTVLKQYPDLVVIEGAHSLMAQFVLPGETSAPQGRIYLIDPLGNLVISYRHGTDPYGIRKDLMRLLTYSWVG